MCFQIFLLILYVWICLHIFTKLWLMFLLLELSINYIIQIIKYSLIGCTRLRAVSGILRTQRGRRGSRGAGQHAGTGSAGPGRHGRPVPISTDLASRPCGSSLSLAPVAQVSRSLLWFNPRPCGSTLAGVGQCPTAIGHGCPAGLRAGVPDRRPVSPLSSSLGAVGRARAGAAVRGSPSAPFFSGARRRSEPALSCARIAGPSQCGGSPAPRGCASLGVTGLSAANQSPISMAPLRLLSRPSWRSGRASLPDARARAVTELVGTVRVSLNSCPPHPLASGPTMLATSPGQWPAHLRQILADSDAGPGSRISRPPRPEVTIRHVPIPSPPFSRLHDHDRLTRAASPSRLCLCLAWCKQPAPLNPCTGFTDYLCANRPAVTLLVLCLRSVGYFSPVIIVPC